MNHRLMVFLGGGAGATTRYAVSTIIAARYSGILPAGTMIINVTGSFLMGLIMMTLTERLVPHPNWRFLLVVGFLGGYTTFSSFEWETLTIVQRGSSTAALVNVIGSVLGGFLAVWAGVKLGKPRSKEG